MKKYLIALLFASLALVAHADNVTVTSCSVATGSDKVLYWHDSAGNCEALNLGTNLSITTGTINAAGGTPTWGSIIGTLSSQTDLQSALNAKVPYSGASGNVDLGSHNFNAQNITVNGGESSGDSLDVAGSVQADYYNASSFGQVIDNAGNIHANSLSLPNQLGNTFLAAPSGTTGPPSFRAIVGADIPTLNQSTTGNAATVTTINGKITAGTNISLSGSGTSGSPYSISASGGGGTPGGSSGALQYNNSGAFGGFGSWDGGTVALDTALGANQVNLTTAGAGGLGLLNYGASDQEIHFGMKWNGSDYIAEDTTVGAIIRAGGQLQTYMNSGNVVGNSANYGPTRMVINDNGFTGIQNDDPEAPLDVIGAVGQTIPGPATLSATLVQDLAVDSPSSAGVVQVNGPSAPPPFSNMNFTYIDATGGGVSANENQPQGSGFTANCQNVSGTIYTYRFAAGGIRVINPNGLGWSMNDSVCDGTTLFQIDLSGWSAPNGYADGYIVQYTDSSVGASFWQDIGNTTSLTISNFTNQDPYVNSQYSSSGSTWNGNVAAYNLINGSPYRSVYQNNQWTDANVSGAYMIMNDTISAPSGYDGSIIQSNNSGFFDLGSATTFDDYGQAGAADFSAFSSFGFPYFDTTPLTESNSGIANQNDGSGNYTANCNSYNWWIYEYKTNPITGIRYFSPGYNFGQSDNCDGQNFYWSINITPGSGDGRIWVNQSGQGGDLGSGTSFNDDGAEPTAPLPSPLLSGFTGNSYLWSAYGTVTSPATKYSTSHRDYSATDTNPPQGFYWQHSWGGFGNAVNIKTIETAGARGPGAIFEGATQSSYTEFFNALGDNTVTPNSVGYLSNGSNLNATYRDYATKTINGVVVWSPSSPTAATVDPNDGNFYTVSLAGGTVSGATYKFSRLKGASTVYQTNTPTTLQDDTTVGWGSSSTLTPDSAPTVAARFQRTISAVTDLPIIQLSNNNSGTVANPGIELCYGAGGGCAFAGQLAINGNAEMALVSNNNGFDFGGTLALNNPYFQLRQSAATFNAQSASSYATDFQGHNIAHDMYVDAATDTVYFGQSASSFPNGDPGAAIAIAPQGSDLAIDIAGGGAGTDAVNSIVKNSSGTILWSLTNQGRMAVNTAFTPITAFGNLAVGPGSSTYSQLVLLGTGSNSPTTPVNGGIERDDAATNGGLVHYTTGGVRRNILLNIVGGNAGDVMRLDSNGNPVTSNAININTGLGLAIFNIATEFKQNATFDAGKTLTLGNATSGGSSGSLWYNGTQVAIYGALGGSGLPESFTGTLFTQSATGTVASSTAETSIDSTGVGTKTLTASSITAGKEILVEGDGFYSTTGTPTLRIKVKLGSTIILDTTAVTMPSSVTNHGFHLHAVITGRTTGASGTVFGQGSFDDKTTPSITLPMVNTAATTIATNASQALTVTAQWGTNNASNTISLTNLSAQLLN